MMQQKLFEVEATTVPAALMITRDPYKILIKQQQTFNRLIKRIENLRLDLEQVNKSLDEKLDYYGKHIHPLEKKLHQANKEQVKALFPFFKNKRLLPQRDNFSLGKFLSDRLTDIFNFEEGETEEEFEVMYR